MLISFITTAILSASLILLLIKYASSLGMLAVPNDRSAHTNATPCGAGVAFISAMFIGIAISGWGIYSTHFLSVIAVFLVFLLGVYDDYKHTSSHSKFLLIFLAGVLVYLDGLSINTLGSYFGTNLPLSYLAIPVTLVAIVGFTNSLNLVDGLDGLAGALSLIILSGINYIGYVHEDAFIVNVSSVLFPALLAFMVFNWNPAKIFMGDSGSLTLGFIIAVLSIKALSYIDPVSILFISAIPIIDTVTVMVRRKRNGLSMVSADKNHLHHIVLNAFNGRVRKTVLVIASMQFMFTLFGIFIAPKIGQEVTLPLFLSCLVAIFISIEIISKKINHNSH